MNSLTRAGQSAFFDKLIEKKAFNFSIQRIATESVKKEDPFEDVNFEEVWIIKGNKLLKKWNKK